MSHLPETAAALHAALARADRLPRADGAGIRFDVRPPRELIPLVRVLHTGIRAIMTGRKWLGFSAATGFPVVLDPTQFVPVWIDYLGVSGDRTWDRMRIREEESLGFLMAGETEPKNWSERTAWIRRRAA